MPRVAAVLLALLLAACQAAPSISAVVDPLIRPVRSDPVLILPPAEPSILERKAIEAFRAGMRRDKFAVVESADLAKWIFTATINRDGADAATDTSSRIVRMTVSVFLSADRDLPRPPRYWTGTLLAHEDDYQSKEPYLIFAVLGMYGKDVEETKARDYPANWFSISGWVRRHAK